MFISSDMVGSVSVIKAINKIIEINFNECCLHMYVIHVQSHFTVLLYDTCDHTKVFSFLLIPYVLENV